MLTWKPLKDTREISTTGCKLCGGILFYRNFLRGKQCCCNFGPVLSVSAAAARLGHGPCTRLPRRTPRKGHGTYCLSSSVVCTRRSFLCASRRLCVLGIPTWNPLKDTPAAACNFNSRVQIVQQNFVFTLIFSTGNRCCYNFGSVLSAAAVRLGHGPYS